MMTTLPVIAGLAIYAYYATMGCDPLAGGVINGPNEVSNDALLCPSISISHLFNLTCISFLSFRLSKMPRIDFDT